MANVEKHNQVAGLGRRQETGLCGRGAHKCVEQTCVTFRLTNILLILLNVQGN